MALEWVQDNIKLFNGNQSKVTIVGQSAGSMAVSLHILGEWQDNERGKCFRLITVLTLKK